MEENITVNSKDVQNNKAIAILAYLSFLVLLPLLAAKDSPFARFHAGQGLTLFITSPAIFVVATILLTIFIFISLTLVFGIYGITCIATLGFLALAIMGTINVINGTKKELPITSKYKFLK